VELGLLRCLCREPVGGAWEVIDLEENICLTRRYVDIKLHLYIL